MSASPTAHLASPRPESPEPVERPDEPTMAAARSKFRSSTSSYDLLQQGAHALLAAAGQDEAAEVPCAGHQAATTELAFAGYEQSGPHAGRQASATERACAGCEQSSGGWRQWLSLVPTGTSCDPNPQAWPLALTDALDDALPQPRWWSVLMQDRSGWIDCLDNLDFGDEEESAGWGGWPWSRRGGEMRSEAPQEEICGEGAEDEEEEDFTWTPRRIFSFVSAEDEDDDDFTESYNDLLEEAEEAM